MYVFLKPKLSSDQLFFILSKHGLDLIVLTNSGIVPVSFKLNRFVIYPAKKKSENKYWKSRAWQKKGMVARLNIGRKLIISCRLRIINLLESHFKQDGAS